MPQSAQPSRSTNINIRVAPEQRNLIDQAAAISSKTRTDFILEAATRAAQDAILDQVYFEVSPEKFDEFLRILDEPPAPSERLIKFLNHTPIWEKK
jgi:uncharacterized protein (DUF1778 family)